MNSSYFTIEELCASQTATRRQIDNTPSPQVTANLNKLVLHVLHPMRVHFGSPVIVTSGYRSPILNTRIGGSRTSDHCLGAAADFTILNVSNAEVLRWLASNCQFKQLIDEFASWIHVSYLDGQNRKECLTARKVRGRTIYAPAKFG